MLWFTYVIEEIRQRAVLVSLCWGITRILLLRGRKIEFSRSAYLTYTDIQWLALGGRWTVLSFLGSPVTRPPDFSNINGDLQAVTPTWRRARRQLPFIVTDLFVKA